MAGPHEWVTGNFAQLVSLFVISDGWCLSLNIIRDGIRVIFEVYSFQGWVGLHFLAGLEGLVVSSVEHGLGLRNHGTAKRFDKSYA